MEELCVKNLGKRRKNEPMRILCVFSRLDRGGAETMCMNLYRHINRKKIQFDFVKHTSEECAFDEEIKYLGGRVFSAPKITCTNILSYLWWWRKHFKEHPEHRIIHAHYPTLAPIYFSIAKRYNRVTIGHAHFVPDKKSRGSLTKTIKSYLWHQVEKKSDYCLACGEAAGRYMFPNKHFEMLKNAIDIDNFLTSISVSYEARKELDLGDDFVVGVVGSIKHVKNPFGTLEIFKEVKKTIPNSKLLWVGDGDMRTVIEEHTENLGLTDSVKMVGIREDVFRLMQAMDCFILPSFSEGLPVVAIEAQAAGMYCFISDSVTQECDVTGRCVFLPIDKPELWSEEIKRRELDKIDTKNSIIKAGYDAEKTARWLEEFYVRVSK